MRRFQIGSCVLPMVMLAGLSASASAATLADDAAAVCGGLAGSSGGVNIDAATLQAPSPLSVAERGPTPAGRVTPANPAFCKVLGSIAPTDPKAPPIKFEVNLPVEWNGRSLQYGGGGFNGVLISGLGLPPAYPFDKPSPLARGFVTYGTDSATRASPASRRNCLRSMTRRSRISRNFPTRRCATPRWRLWCAPTARSRKKCISWDRPRVAARR